MSRGKMSRGKMSLYLTDFDFTLTSPDDDFMYSVYSFNLIAH